MNYLKQSTAVDIAIGPFVDSLDGVTPETGLSLTQAECRLKKNAAAWAQKNESTTGSHEEEGWYEINLDATDTDTLGTLAVAVYISGALPVWRFFQVLPAVVYDSLVAGTDLLQVDLQQIGGDAQSATDLKDFADSGYDPSTNKVEGVKLADTLTTYTGNTPQTGDNYAVVNSGAHGNAALKTLIDASDDKLDTLVSAAQPIISNLTVTDVAPTTTSFDTNLVGAVDDMYKDALVKFKDTSANYGVSRPILSSTAAGLLTFDEPWPVLPVNGDPFALEITHIHSVSDIQDGLALEATSQSILARIGAFTGTGVNTLLGFFKALLSKTATTPSDVGGTFDPATDSTEAIRDRGDAAWTGGGGGDDPWLTELPGAYDPGTAGYILGTNLDQKISDIEGGPSQTIVVGAGLNCNRVQYFDAGEVKPVGSHLEASTGTLTISAVTVTLQDADGVPMYGIENLDATGFDTGGLTLARAWYLLDSASPPADGPIAVGTYSMVFHYEYTTSDGLSRESDVPVTVKVS